MNTTTKIEKRDRDEMNEALRERGLDGNGRFASASRALTAALEVLGESGIEIGEVVTADVFGTTGAGDETGRKTFEVAVSNQDNPFAPTEVSNTVLALDWTELAPERFEAIAYLS